MKTKFLGNYLQLQKCVLDTRLAGKWHKLRSGHKQFRSYHGGILNWWQSTGTITFQGGELAATELEQGFTKIASAQKLLHSKDARTPQEATEEID
jgi:hypothetical protein